MRNPPAQGHDKNWYPVSFDRFSYLKIEAFGMRLPLMTGKSSPRLHTLKSYVPPILNLMVGCGLW